MKTTANNNSETKKFYVIASSEYEANMPDLFIMNDNGEYFGVSGHSYAAWHNYPKSINFWMGAEGSDAGRYFNIDEVELTQAQVDEFDRITKEYARLDAETPTFERQYPVSRDYKTKKAYNQAVNDFMAAHDEWCKKSNIGYYINTKRDLMSGIVGELHELGKTDHWIMKHLGMDADEVLRLKQISGLASLFKDKDFSKAKEL